MAVRLSIAATTAAEVVQLIRAELDRANGKARTRRLEWGEVEGVVLLALSGIPVARHYAVGKMPNSYGFRAEATSAEVYADGKAMKFWAGRISMGHAPHGGGGAQWEWVPSSALFGRDLRLDEATAARYALLPTAEEQKLTRWDPAGKRFRFAAKVEAAVAKKMAELGLSSWRGSGGITLHTDQAYRIVDDTRGKRIAERYALKDGRLVRSGYATQEKVDPAALGAPKSGWYWEHGATVAECRAEGRRKRERFATLAAERAERDRLRALSAAEQARAERRVRLLARLSTSLTATMQDARDAGLCRAGVESWCQARGIDPAGAVGISRLAHDEDRRAQAVALKVARRALISQQQQEV